MAYKKIYYDEIWNITSKGTMKCKTWMQNIADIQKPIANFNESSQYKGKAADSTRDYFNEVHGKLFSIFYAILKVYETKAESYYSGYEASVDSGDGSKYGLRYTTLVNDEIAPQYGSIIKRLNNVRDMAEAVKSEANSTKWSISDLVTITSSPIINNLLADIDAAIKKATDVHNKANDFESRRANDFAEIDRLIAQATSIINAQLGKSRTPVIAYQKGSISSMCDLESVNKDIEAAKKIVIDFENSDEYERAEYLATNRDSLIKEEEQSDRQWVQWVAVGIGIAGSIALTVVTAGAASPLLCVAVGAATSAVTVAANRFAENYVENGDFVDGMNWNDFGKEVFVAAVSGGVSGYLGTLSTGSAIKQPIKNALTSAKNAIFTTGAEGLAEMTWNIGEAFWNKKPGDDIAGIILLDAKDTIKNVSIEGGKSFASGYILGRFNVDVPDKSYLQKLGEKTLANASEELTGGVIKTSWNMGEAAFSNDKVDIKSILKDNATETAKDFVGSEFNSLVSEIDTKNALKKGFRGTAAKTLERIGEGVTERTIKQDDGNVLKDIWKEDLQGGRTIFKDAGESIGKNVLDEKLKDKKIEKELNKLDHDKDGKVKFVQFGDKSVTKEDYDAAKENADKGIYKGKTAQDLLGLSKDTDLSSGKEKNVSIKRAKEYESERKTTDTVTVNSADNKSYTFKKDFYEAATNAAGKGDYKGKTAQEILGVPKNTDVSSGNVEIKNINSKDMNKVKLTNDDSSTVKKYQFKNSSTKKETNKSNNKK